MKIRKVLLTAILAFAAPLLGAAQGTFIYDQQSSTIEGPYAYGGGPMQQILPPWGQSFTPTLGGIDFIRLAMADVDAGGPNAVVYLNLMSGSIGGPVIATTLPTTLMSGFTGNPNFFFADTIPLTPGVTYFFTPVAEAGSAPLQIIGGSYNYSGGTYYYGGSPVLQSDLWFREGLYVPEPSSAALILAGAGALLLCRRKRCAIT